MLIGKCWSARNVHTYARSPVIGYPFSASVGFRTLVPLVFSTYFDVTNHSTNFRPIVFEHPVYKG